MKRRFQIEQSGAIAIFLVIVLGILLLVTTTTAARLNVSELNQSSQVDRSDQSYYAAEAGVEEASRRLDNNPAERKLNILFPEQYDGTGQLVGDMFALVDQNGNPNVDYSGITNPGNGIRNETGNPGEIGQLAWRNRRVYASEINPTGSLVKDQSIQTDTTDLRRNCAGGGVAGANGNDCDGTPIFNNFDGITFCWTPTLPSGFTAIPGPPPGNTHIEFTVLSYDAGSFGGSTPVRTEKFMTDYVTGVRIPSGVAGGESLQTVGGGPGVTCFRFGVDQSRRYIFRSKLIIEGALPPVAGQTQNTYSVNYVITLDPQPVIKNGVPSSPPLYVPNDTLLIDVIGQSGPIRRRIVAQKQRNGHIHGIFDFVLYQGDKVFPLCKAGVQQSDVGYDTGACVPVFPNGRNFNQ